MADTVKLSSGASRPGVLAVSINSKSALYASYMPFLKRGGLFIPTNRTYALDEEVFVLLSLLSDATKLPIAGKVVWITPAGAHSNKTQGIGVHFSDDESGQTARTRIEALLGSHLGSSRMPHTM